jgi:hypothetical protein
MIKFLVLLVSILIYVYVPFSGQIFTSQFNNGCNSLSNNNDFRNYKYSIENIKHISNLEDEVNSIFCKNFKSKNILKSEYKLVNNKNINSSDVVKHDDEIYKNCLCGNEIKQNCGIATDPSGWLEGVINGNSDFPAMLANVVIAYLTILISVAIAIFSEKKEFETLDRNVILDHIIKAKQILYYLGFTFVPILFWNVLETNIKILGVILWIFGVCCINKILINSYRWMKGNKFKFRFDYLKKIQDEQDMEEAWRSVWETQNINYQNEIYFFEIFCDIINKFLKNQNINNKIYLKILSDFDIFFKLRSSEFLNFANKTISFFLMWNFEFWKKENIYLYEDNKIDLYSMYNQVSLAVDSIVRQSFSIALKSRHSYSFFKALKEHVEKNKNTVVSNKLYIEFLFDQFFEVFFENIHNSPEKFNIWNHYYPTEWKITKDNLQNSENQVSCIALDIFLKWAVDKIWEDKDENDFALDDVSRNIFPEVDPILWALILIFIYSPYDNDRMRSVIERKWIFGFFGNTKISKNSKINVNKQFNDEFLSTIELSNFIFKDEFSEDKIIKYIDLLNHISYPKESREERKRLRLYNLFTRMLDLTMNSAEVSECKEHESYES